MRYNVYRKQGKRKSLRLPETGKTGKTTKKKQPSLQGSSEKAGIMYDYTESEKERTARESRVKDIKEIFNILHDEKDNELYIAAARFFHTGTYQMSDISADLEQYRKNLIKSGESEEDAFDRIICAIETGRDENMTDDFSFRRRFYQITENDAFDITVLVSIKDVDYDIQLVAEKLYHEREESKKFLSENADSEAAVKIAEILTRRN